MATCDCIPVKLVGIFSNGFYFEDDHQDGVDTDTFVHSKTFQKLIRCSDSRFLIVNEDEQFDLEDLTIEQLSSPSYTFYIKIYRDLSRQSKDGRPVMLYAFKNGKNIAAVCKDNTICPEEMEPLHRIEDSKHRALFYMTLCQKPNKYRLRSSWYPDKSLGFDETDSSPKKLVLRPFDPEDECDTFTLCENKV